MEQWLIHIVTDYPYLIYGFVVLLASAEGPVLSMVFGVLIKLGYLAFIPIYAALMLGDLIGDVVWYYIGRYAGHRFIRRFGKYFSITEEGVTKVTKIFHSHKHSILLISKMTNGFGFALVTLMTAGMARIPFAKYMAINLLGQFVWTGLLLGVGYFFGHLYTNVETVLGRLSVATLFILVFVAFMGYKKYLRTRAERMEIL